MFNQPRVRSALRCIVLLASALVALPACVEGDEGDDDDNAVEASVDPLVAPGGASGNMLSNPGFETAFASTDWWLGNTWEGPGRAFRSSSARHAGTYGLRLTGFAFLIHKEVTTTAGARYAISGYARKTTAGKTPCWMEVQFYPSGGVYKTASVSTTDWRTYGVTVTAPPGTTTARVQVRRDPGTSETVDVCDWDDFSFHRVY